MVNGTTVAVGVVHGLHIHLAIAGAKIGVLRPRLQIHTRTTDFVAAIQRVGGGRDQGLKQTCRDG